VSEPTARDPLLVMPVVGLPEITPGDDLAALIAGCAPWLESGDVLVVTSKIVSKAEGRLVELPAAEGEQREAARRAVLASETARVVASRGPMQIVATHHGFVMAAAGIDASNVDKGWLVLLPKDPDSSARALRAAFAERHGLDVAVVISDTMGRPWRVGLTDVALGAAGLEPVLDHRGQHDAYGNELQVTQVAVADELCSAADLVKGKVDGVPVAVVRGFLPRPEAGAPPAPDGPGAVAMVRDSADDLFSLGTAEARAEGLAGAARLPYVMPLQTSGIDVVAVAQALSGMGLAPSTVVRLEIADGVPTLHCRAGREPNALVALGIDVHRLRCALAAHGFATSLVAVDVDDAPPDSELVAIAIGYPAASAATS